MRLKWTDKQQRYHHGIGTSTTTYSQASNHYPLSHTQMQAPQQHMPQTFTHVPQGQPQQQHLHHSQQDFQQTFTQPHAPAQHQFLACCQSSPYNSSSSSPYNKLSQVQSSSTRNKAANKLHKNKHHTAHIPLSRGSCSHHSQTLGERAA